MLMGTLQKPHKVNMREDIDLTTAVVWISIVFTFVFSKHSILLHYMQREGLFFLKSSSEDRHSYTCGMYEGVKDLFKLYFIVPLCCILIVVV